MRRRIFVGLPVAPEPAHELVRFARRAVTGDPLRLVEPANLHATLVFCGDVDAERVGDVVDAVDEETPFDLAYELLPAGVRQLGTAVAVTYTAPPALVDLQRSLERRLVAAGLAASEHRRWLPHVTVGRLRTRTRLRLAAAAPPPHALAGDEVVVYESLLSPHGASYVACASSPRR